MRTNIDIDEQTLESAMRAGAYKTKKDAVEAGLKLLARQAAYREILRWEGKLRWDDEAAADAPQALRTGAAGKARVAGAAEPGKPRGKGAVRGRR